MWRDIKGYEGIYQVSENGRVRRLYDTKPPRILKGRPGLYPTVSLCVGCHKKSVNVHRLVAETYLDIPQGERLEVNHKDGNTWNNDISNLEWVTQAENIKHAHDVLHKGQRGKAPMPVKCIDIETGETVKKFPSISDAAREVYGQDSLNGRVYITNACRGKRKTAKGYRWEYIN